MKNLFSLIIPIYNTAKYLADCFNSVISQTESVDAEIICINDGSTDNSMQVLQPYLERYPNIRLIDQANAGLSAARNAGIQQAKGEYLLFLDSDDMLASDALTLLRQAIEQYSNPDMLAFGSQLWYDEEDGRQVPNVLFNHTQSRMYSSGMAYLTDFVQSRGWGPSAACFYAYKRRWLHNTGLCFPSGLLHEDELFVPQAITLANSLCTVPDMLYIYRMRGTSIVHTESERHYRDKLTIAHRLEVFCQKQGTINSTIQRILYSLSLNAILGLKRLNLPVPLNEFCRVWHLAGNIKEKLKLLKKWLKCPNHEV
ncbi:MAG: glycosyltransferase family 2 protein [Paludibacteraceae bacterium]